MNRLLPLFLLFLFPISPSLSLPPFWADNIEISLGQGLSSDVDSCSIDDRIYVVWSDNRTGNNELFFRYSENAGHTWSREEKITETPEESIQPAIACDQKNVYVVWREVSVEDNKEKTSRIYYKKWDRELWSDDLLISDEKSKNPDIASTSIFPGYVYIVWQQENNAITAYLIRSSDSGKSFSSPQSIAEGIWETKEPSIWCGARDAYVTWADNREGQWHIFFRRWGEVTIGSDIKLSPAQNCSFPAIYGSEPKIYAVWQCKRDFYSDIYISSSLNFGAEWSVATRLTEGQGEAVFPDVVVSDNTPWFFWQDGRNGVWQIWMLDGSDTEPLTEIANPSILPVATSTFKQLHLFWSRIDSKTVSRIIYTKRDSLPPKKLETPYHYDLSASVGYDDDRQVTFAWKPLEPESGLKYNVYVSVDGEDFTLASDTTDIEYNIQGVDGKEYQIYVEAIDTVGNVGPPSALSKKVICDPSPPEVSISSPRNGSTIRSTVPIIASVRDANLLEWKIEYGATSAPDSYETLAGPFYEGSEYSDLMFYGNNINWDTSSLDGIYTIRVSASDKAGNRSRIMATVNIDSRPPADISPGASAQLSSSDSQWVYRSPSWSVDGKIVFCSNEGGSMDIWTMSANEKKRLTQNRDVELNPRWSPSGDMIAFQSLSIGSDKKEKWKIWVMKSDGTDAHPITSGEWSDENPSWSPDGSAIVFDSDRDGRSNIWIITDIKNEPKLIKLTDNRWDDRNPEWSPDGARIVFQTNRNGNWDLFEIGPDGEKPFITTPADEMEPGWSADSKWVVFSTNQPSDHYEIRALSWLEKSNYVILSPSDHDAHNPQWSPDMVSVAYESRNSLFLSPIVSSVRSLEGIILSPRPGEIVTGKVEIRGIARGGNFAKYSLMYSDRLDSTPQNAISYHLIGGESTAQVETGFLGIWQTDELEGNFLLKLVVTDIDGKSIESSIQVAISNRAPYISLNEPKDNSITGKSVIKVSGYADRKAILTLNGESLYLSDNGNFSRDIQLSEGNNKIVLKAMSISNKEYTVERNVILDTNSPVIAIESPGDYQLVKTPYITIKGSVSEKAEVIIQSVRAWTDENGDFQRTISIQEGINSIQIAASDVIGHYSSVLRRVIYQRDSDIASDNQKPAITDAFPDNHAIVANLHCEISARLTDNVGINPFSIVFSFDGTEIEDYILDVDLEKETVGIDQYPSIHLSYSPLLSEGNHSYEIQISDTSGNEITSSFTFTCDIDPPEAMVSALLSDTADGIQIILSSNKSISSISSALVTSSLFTKGLSEKPEVVDAGYSVSFSEKDEHYEASLDISPSQKSFRIDVTAKVVNGGEISAHGYMAWSFARYGDWFPISTEQRLIHLGITDGPNFQAVQNQTFPKTLKVSFMLRSQDGLDPDMLEMYYNDADYRNLRLAGLIYVLSASEQVHYLFEQGILSLPVEHGLDHRSLILFSWDKVLKIWQPLDRLGGSDRLISSRINDFGTYALFADAEPPIIKDVSPMDGKEIPLEKFFLEANISDIGSGVSSVELAIDGNRVDYSYDFDTGNFSYYPSGLEWGLHRAIITAIDRAGNVSKLSTSFLNQDVFQFIEVLAYPNPASESAHIKFSLTRYSDVTLRIYSITGELVFESKKQNIARGIFEWKLANSSGKKAASGVYIYIIEAQIFETKMYKHGKIAIVR